MVKTSPKSPAPRRSPRIRGSWQQKRPGRRDVADASDTPCLQVNALKLLHRLLGGPRGRLRRTRNPHSLRASAGGASLAPASRASAPGHRGDFAPAGAYVTVSGNCFCLGLPPDVGQTEVIPQKVSPPNM